jgi:lysophospholipase L1-like esterase
VVYNNIKEITMKRILCYGDSNTWGSDPLTGERLDDQTRWTRVMAGALGPDYEVIEEGLSGRTTVWDDPIEGYKNGYTYLLPCLETHRPLDLVVIMLGTNDLKKRFSLTAYDIAQGAGVLVAAVQKSSVGREAKAPPVLLMAPPPVGRLTDYAEMFEDSLEKSRKLGERFRQVAEESGCAFLDTSTVIVSSKIDGIHFDPQQHTQLGNAVAGIINSLLE